MFQSVNCFIGYRYSQSRSRTGFVSFITFFSIVGILLGVASLITVVSVMNGFEGELKKRVLGIVPHILVETDKPLADAQTSLLAIPEVNNVTPFEQTEALVQSVNGLAGVLIQGVTPSYEHQTILRQHFVAGGFDQLTAGGYRAVIGQALAQKLAISLGDDIRLVVPNRTIFTPMGRIPMQRVFTVVGLFNLGSQIDDSVIYIHSQDANKLMRKNQQDKHFIRLYLNDAFDAKTLVPTIESILPNSDVTTWQHSQGALFSAVKMEKNMMWLMLSLIVAVAAFNIVSALVMVVNDKQGEISILQTMGMTRSGILQIFITQGMVNGAWGVTLGLLAGLALTFGLNPLLALFNINVFGVGYTNQILPIQLQWLDVFIIVIGAFSMSFLATLYPAYRAAQTLPAEVLRNE
ncbi:lipoprotein-releasing ABC transporter permease subunit [Colwellia sp. MEBiC06753]